MYSHAAGLAGFIASHATFTAACDCSGGFVVVQIGARIMAIANRNQPLLRVFWLGLRVLHVALLAL
jgi:hypothetical protein